MDFVPFVNVHKLLCSDLLHTIWRGLVAHMLEWLEHEVMQEGGGPAWSLFQRRLMLAPYCKEIRSFPDGSEFANMTAHDAEALCKVSGPSSQWPTYIACYSF
jgi:hypothetical protein